VTAPVAKPPTAPAALPPVALYVHIPFCVSLCPYCDFVVYAGAAARGPRKRVAAFLAALETELDLRAAAVSGVPGVPQPLETVYLGGGTPSLLPPDAIARLLDRIRAQFGLTAGAEVTLESNPGPDERGEASSWRDVGVTRISFGAQSMHPGELRRLGRRHGPDDVAQAVEAARAAGIASVSLDLVYDVPESTEERWAATLEAALALSPDHLSLYALTLDDPDAEGLTGALGDHLPTTSGARRWRDRARTDQDDDRAAAQYRHAVERLAADGWRGYEISNWARPGHESRHNLVYWERRPYEAIGPGAHAFDGATRRWNAARLDGYIAALSPADRSSSRLPPGGAEALDRPTARSEALILGLRTDRGVPAEAAAHPPLDGVALWAAGAGLLEERGDRLVLTTEGRLLSNEVFARLV
jgi:oxygen-independent coproporphyrinogen III oxidase